MAGTNTILLLIAVTFLVIAIIAGSQFKKDGSKRRDGKGTVRDNGQDKRGFSEERQEYPDVLNREYNPLLVAQMKANYAKLRMDLHTLDTARRMHDVARRQRRENDPYG